MIKCETCGTEFPKPTTRGRPPKRCEDCRAKGTKPKKAGSKGSGGKAKGRNPEYYDWGRANTPKNSETSEEDDESEESAATRKRRNNFRTGFCGVTRILGRVFTHAEEIHRLCPGSTLNCKCKCHEGVAVWDLNPKMVV